MMKDVECPYCNEYQEINHDDGYGYEEDKVHEQCCNDCGKHFAFTTSISFSYEASRADCMNGGDHQFETTHTHPKIHTKMRCHDCDSVRPLTEEEWFEFLDVMECV